MEGGPPAYRYSSAEVFPKPNLHARFSNNLTQDLKTEKRKLMKQVKDVQDVKKMEEEGKTIGFGIQVFFGFIKICLFISLLTISSKGIFQIYENSKTSR